MQINMHVNLCSAASIEFEFDRTMHTRTSDFSVYATTGYKGNEDDSVLLKALLDRLMTPNSGAISVRVSSPYGFEVKYSKASGYAVIRETVQAVLEEEGATVSCEEGALLRSLS